jgi:5-(carboxyamino)imidazole ribonucleotide mutase
MMPKKVRPLVGIAMGSDSDLPVMKEAAAICKQFGVPYELRILSAHRTPQAMAAYAEKALARGVRVMIAGAGGAAHLPGMIAAITTIPVIGVPIPTRALAGLDSLLSIIQMPPGVPVATVAIGAGKNAGLLACQILAAAIPGLHRKLARYKIAMARKVARKDRSLHRRSRRRK